MNILHVVQKTEAGHLATQVQLKRFIKVSEGALCHVCSKTAACSAVWRSKTMVRAVDPSQEYHPARPTPGGGGLEHPHHPVSEKHSAWFISGPNYMFMCTDCILPWKASANPKTVCETKYPFTLNLTIGRYRCRGNNSDIPRTD